MTTKIGLVSDVHATPDPLREALSIFKQEQVDLSVCAGDIAGYGNRLDETVKLLIEHQCRVISGNHDLWYAESSTGSREQWIADYFLGLPATLEFTFENKSIYVVHASPPDSNMKGIKLLDIDGEIIPDRKSKWTHTLEAYQYDVLVIGHTHQVFAERLGNTLVINPGSTKFNHCCSILTLPELTVQTFPLSNKTPRMVWNWGQIERMPEE